MYYNMHTHHREQQAEVLSVENISVNFSQELVSRKVSMGLHPWYLKEEDWEHQLASLIDNASKHEVIAIGECGLDKLTTTSGALQLSAFQAQISLAQKLQKPIVIHCVKSFEEVLFELKQVTVPVIFHGINNKSSIVRRAIDMGYYFSFGQSIVNFNQAVHETFRAVPMDRMFLETDDSEIGIGEVYKSAALLRGIAEKEIVLQIETNFLKVFGN
ncbi:TatD family hydrolase [Dyadobacter sp. 32]|uniref:TatD family hydrolase n=1 Tax=Dyadobacter sp. 32 TaxID=538966 RepID=UPI0011EE3837